MKSKMTLVLLVLFLVVKLHSQTIFSKAVDAVTSNEYGAELVYKNKKYYLAGKGIVRDTINKKFVNHDYLAILDENANIENVYIIRDLFNHHGLIYENDTLYLQGSDYIKFNEDTLIWNMYRFTSEGDSIDLHSYTPEKNRFGWAKTFIKDNYIYSVGFTEKNEKSGSDIMVVKMSKSGELIKENRFHGFANPKYVNRVMDMTPTTDGNFVVPILYFGVPWDIDTTHGPSTEHIAICKFDENLDTIWTRQVSKTIHTNSVNGDPHVSPTKEGGVYIATSHNLEDSMHYSHSDYYKDMVMFPLLFCKYDKEGTRIWTDTLFDYREPGKGTGPIKTILGMKTAKNGDLIGCGVYYNLYDEPKNQAWAFRYGSDGHLKWQHTYVDREYYAYYSLFFDIEEAENGDIILFGGLDTDNKGEWYNTQYSWLLRVDSNGCYSPGCELADTLTKVLTDIEDLTTRGLAKRVEIYPNPASGYITANLPPDVKWQEYIIYDMEGKKIKTSKIKSRFHKLKIQGISEMGKGLHFLMLRGEKGKVGIGKFVVE